jgi:hypothetical protein
MDALNYLPTMFTEHLRGIDLVYAGVIAVIFGMLTERAVGVFAVPLIAAGVYIAAQSTIMPLLNHGAIITPELDRQMFEQVVALYIFFLVADTAVYAVKKTIATITT